MGSCFETILALQSGHLMRSLEQASQKECPQAMTIGVRDKPKALQQTPHSMCPYRLWFITYDYYL